MPPYLHTGIISDMKTIARLLSEACESRALLHICLEGQENRQVAARFLELDAQGNIIVEPLLSEGEDAALLSAGKVTGSFVFKSNKYTFETSCMGPATHCFGGVLMVCPAQLQKIELRNFYRLRLGDDSFITVYLSKGNLVDAPVEGRVVDMSEGGLSCEIPPARGIEQGGWVDHVQFTLPNGYVVSTSATIKRVAPLRAVSENALWLCGLEFGHLDQADRFALVDFIFEKQREEIRKKKHLL